MQSVTQDTSAHVPVCSPGEYLHMHCSGFLYAAVVKCSNKKQRSGAAEMTQVLRALAVFAEDPGQAPSIHLAAHNHLSNQFPRILHPLLVSVVTRHTRHALVNTRQTQTQKRKINIFRNAI